METPADIPPPVKYSEDMFTLRFLDILSYPRPARKFKMLFGKSTLIAFVREMMLSEVGMDEINDLVLLSHGKEIPRSSDELTLLEAGFKSNQQIVISRRLGAEATTTTTTTAAPIDEGAGQGEKMTEKNRQFLGDLLFGAGGDGNGSVPPAGQSIVKTFKISHGYQILGKCLERMIMLRFSQAYAREEGARKSEEELYALLEEENLTKVRVCVCACVRAVMAVEMNEYI